MFNYENPVMEKPPPTYGGSGKAKAAKSRRDETGNRKTNRVTSPVKKAVPKHNFHNSTIAVIAKGNIHDRSRKNKTGSNQIQTRER